jgi:hypothetical protein
MEVKPDYKSYFLRQISFTRYPWIIRSKDRYIFEEIHGLLHNVILSILEIIIMFSLFYYVLIYEPYNWLINTCVLTDYGYGGY